MKIIGKEEFLAKKEFFISEMKKGRILIYPTDTIYGLGCDATNGDAVIKIREIKKRDGKPFSIIAPSFDWIRQNCFIDALVEKWLKKLPGSYTFILELRNWKAISSAVNGGRDSLGVRIPDNWFAEAIKEFGKPFVTTSVNSSGGKNMEKLEDLDASIKSKVDYIIYEGPLEGNASGVVKLIGGKEEILR